VLWLVAEGSEWLPVLVAWSKAFFSALVGWAIVVHKGHAPAAPRVVESSRPSGMLLPASLAAGTGSEGVVTVAGTPSDTRRRALWVPGLGAAALAASGLATAGVIAWQPRWVARASTRCWSMVFAVRTEQPHVALTFDDGPHRETTPALLEVLGAHDAGATFFLIGSRTAERLDLARRVVREGHEVGNHLWEDRPSLFASPRAFERDLVRTGALLSDTLGSRPVFVRPASGWFSPWMVSVARRHGYRLALGSIAPLDPALHRPQRALRFVVERIQPGAVVVLHEGYPGRDRMAGVVDAVLADLGSRGLQAVTLSALVRGSG
jgi:peptidoglycan-N-acetylglucosamine deacetylase